MSLLVFLLVFTVQMNFGTLQVKALEAAVVSPSGDPKNSALTRLLSENCTPSDLRSRAVLSSPDSVELSTPQVGPRELAQVG